MSAGIALGALQPPEVPLAYVTLELDLVTRNLMVNHEPLRVYLKKFVDFVKDGVTKGCGAIQGELDEEISETKKSLHIAMAERIATLQGSLKAVDDLPEMKAETIQVKNRVTSLEQTLKKQAEELERLREDMKAATDDSVSRRISMSPSNATPTARRLSMNLAGGAVSPNPASPSAGGRGLTSRGSNKPGNTGGFPAPSSAELQDVQRAIKELMLQSEQTLAQVQIIEEKFDGEVDRIVGRLDGEEERTAALKEKLEKLSQRFSQLDEAFASQDEQFASVHATIDHVAREQADRLKLLRDEMNQLGALAEKGAVVADLAPRVNNLERGRRQADAAAEQVSKHIEALERDLQQTGAGIGECEDSIADLQQRLQSDLTERCAELLDRDDVISERIVSIEEDIGVVRQALQGMDSKADSQEVAVIRNLLGGLAEDFKEKEPSVLFGARCLSCNRVFDDVDRNSGVVNHKLEKQRAQVLAEIQRALHSPRCDPLAPINLLAVKVGRPGGIKGGAGVYAGRDTAGGLLRGVEDVALLPAPVRHVSAVIPDGGVAPPPSSVVQPSPPSGRPGSGRSPRSTGGRPRIATTSGQLAAVREAKPKEGVSAVDFKHPLSTLLGRPGGGGASLAATAPVGLG